MDEVIFSFIQTRGGNDRQTDRYLVLVDRQAAQTVDQEEGLQTDRQLLKCSERGHAPYLLSRYRCLQNDL